MNELLDLISHSRVFDLAQPLYAGVPHFPTHPPYLFTLNKLHGEFVNPGGGSSASETITLGGHVGTHIDALNHFSCNGLLYGDTPPTQSPTAGVTPHSVDSIAPILRRAVLLDIARLAGVEALSPDFAITPEHLEAAAPEIRSGDIVLLRTGWSGYWSDPDQYVTAGTRKHVKGPGPELDAARWLSARGIFAAGSDTLCFERVPSPPMPVHVHLLVESGIHIVENLNLDELAAAGIREFLFVAAPLRIAGGTGSPIRPIAVVPRDVPGDAPR